MHREHRVPTPLGPIHAVEWLPTGTRPHQAPIVLLHDSLGSVALWRSFPAALAEAANRRVIAYDRLGFGRSAPRHETLTPAFVADESRQGFEPLHGHLVRGPFVLMGHSVGGGMAVHIAADRPRECLALVTESAQAFAEDLTLQSIAQAKADFADPMQFERLVKHHGDKARWVLDAWTGTWLSPAFAAWTLVDVLPRVQCPTLVLHGEFDEYGSSAHPDLIAARVAGPAQRVLLPGAHHVPHREDEADIVRRVVGFLHGLGL